jgi:hypothetical protein
MGREYYTKGRDQKCVISVGKPDGKKALGRPSRRWKANILLALKETGHKGMDWIRLPQDRNQWRDLVKVLMSHEPTESMKGGEFLNKAPEQLVSFSRKIGLAELVILT